MIPSLRCGRQPYGVLPVTSLDQWQPPAGQEQAMAPDAWLRDLLIKLRNNIWRPRLGEAFRMGRRSPSAPDADLADIMRMDAISSGYSARTMLGRHYLQHLRAFLGEDLAANGFIGTHDALAAGILQRLGIPWRPRLARTVGADTAWAVSAPLVQDGEVSPWRGLEPNYIAALLARTAGCGAQDTFYVGNMKGVGRIYQQTFIDTYAKVAFAKLYDRKTPITAADLVNDRVVPFYDAREVRLCRVLTDRGTEYCGNPERHEYELYLALEDIDHSRTKTKSPQTNGIVERFHKTVLDEFYRVAFRKKIYGSIAELQGDLDSWVQSYNEERPHQGRWCFGKTPMQTFLDATPLAKEKMIAA